MPTSYEAPQLLILSITFYFSTLKMEEGFVYETSRNYTYYPL
jgi:hypothetical protein